MGLKRFAEAFALYEQLAEKFKLGAVWFEYGSAAVGSGDFELGDQIWQKLIGREPNNTALLWQLAEEYGKLSMFSKADALFSKAGNLDPNNQVMQLRHVSHLARTGAVDEARAALNKCMALDPSNEWARFFSAHLDRFENKITDAERQLRDLLASAPRNPELLSGCNHELAYIYDRMERFEDAFYHLQEAKNVAANYFNINAQRKAFEERREKTLRATNSLPRNIHRTSGADCFRRRRAPPQFLLRFWGASSVAAPHFWRRIIDANPATAAYDEILAFQTITPLIDITAPDIPAEGLNFFRQRYLKNLTLDSGPPGEGKILLDKNPGATTSLPALLRAFPELRVIIALRDPRDVLVSSYFMRPTHYIHVSLVGGMR